MVINPKVSSSFPSPLIDALPPITIGNTEIPTSALDTEKKETKSIVKVKDGETVILGGLIHRDKQVITKKLPILGDIPFLGALFRHKDVTKDLERELLVFITPHIVKDTIEFAQTKKVTPPEREQNTISAIDRRAIIASSLNNFEKKKK
jgi:type II secretory pathway component GspD/PulD (secretin)